MSEHDSEDARGKLAEVQAAASLAEADFEDLLVDLDDITAKRKPDPELEARYVELRDEVVRRLLVSGPKYYIDADGVKRYAYAVVPDRVLVDVEDLQAMVEEGQLPPELLDQIAPRRVDNEAFKRACQAGRLTPDQIARCARVRMGTGHVRFADPVDR